MANFSKFDRTPSHNDRDDANFFCGGRLKPEQLHVLKLDTSLKNTQDFCPRVRTLYQPVDPRLSASVFDIQYKVDNNIPLEPTPPLDFSSFDKRVNSLETKLSSLSELLKSQNQPSEAQ